jgi:integrase
MNTQKPSKAAPVKDSKTSHSGSGSGQAGLGLNDKSAVKVQKGSSALGKGDARFWMQNGKLIRRNGSPNYSFQIQFKGRRLTFTSRTANKDAAARFAAGVYLDLLAMGVEATLLKHRPEMRGEDEGEMPVATVGEWIEAAEKVSQTKGATFHSYATALRKIVGDLLGVKRSDKRFGPKSGGAAKYREKVDAGRLDLLSPTALQAWRLAYVGKAKNPKQQASRMTSCNSTIRMARSLFAPKVVKFIPDLRLPEPLPLAGVEFFPRQSAKYFSKIDPKELLQAAREELSEKEPAAFLAMILALAAGLRRGEIDSLCWGQVDFNRQLIRVEETEVGGLKSRDSRAEVPIDENVVAILRGFHAKLKSRDTAGIFVVPGTGKPGGHKKWGRQYRADAVFTKLTDWLRGKGVDARKPLHELRKELGALVTAEHGIYAASRVLRHADVSTTARHYSDLKTRPVVNVGAWLLEENVARMEEVPAPSAEEKGFHEKKAPKFKKAASQRVGR